MTSAIVFGGTFDPVHNGHLAIATQVCERLDADEVWFVPSNVPHLHAAPRAVADARLELLRAAVADDPRFRVLDDEVRRGGVSYTVDTMAQLHAEHPDHELQILLGADAARGVRAWHERERLLAQERFVVVNRTGCDDVTAAELEVLGYAPNAVQVLHVASPDVSATEVRRRAAAGERLDALVPARVAAIIRERGLYAVQPVHTTGG